MRIIAGNLRGRRLESPEDNRVRPTTDKVKEAVFSMISHYIEDATVIDLFAGTGSLGLEAISRGANHVYFVDKSRDSINIIKENIHRCGVEDACDVIINDYQKALQTIHEKADIIFVDPPYKAGYMEKCIALICGCDRISDGGIVVAEHAKDDQMPEYIEDLVRIKEKRYGKIAVSIYEKMRDNSSDDEV